MKFSIKSFYSIRRATLLFFLTLWSVMRLYYSGLLETAVRIIRLQRFVDDCRRIGDNDSRIEFNCAGNGTSHVYIFPSSDDKKPKVWEPLSRFTYVEKHQRVRYYGRITETSRHWLTSAKASENTVVAISV